MIKVCVPVSGKDAKTAKKMADDALSSGADLVEIRADLIHGIEIEDIKKGFTGILDRSIITLRSENEGGESDLSGARRNDWLASAMGLKPAFVDLELKTDDKLISKYANERDRVIVSRHFLSKWTNADVIGTLKECCSLGGIGKVAVKVDNVVQSIDILEQVADSDLQNHAFMTMGAGGEVSRALASSTRSRIVYSALTDNTKVAPGQLDLNAQKRVIRSDPIIVGLLGHPLGHTLSPRMQNAAFEKLDLPGIYMTFDVPDAKKVTNFIRKASKLGIRGFNVTIPYKEIAFSSVDSIDNDARRAGAVNTIALEPDGTLKGYNTDIFGFSEAIKTSGFNPRNKRALIVGAGGASRAAIIGLWKMGAKMMIANRTPERAEQLVRSMRVFIKTIPLDKLENEKPFNLIINATPVGMRGFGNDAIIPENLVARADAVMDMVYNPIETPLVSLAEKNNVKTIQGLDMLLHQGAKAFEIWTGTKAPLDVMKKELLEAIKK